MAPSNTQSLHDILSARHFSSLADHDASVDVPTVTVTPVTSPPLPIANDGPESEPQEEDMNAPRRVRKAGRPRLDADGGAILSEDRRKQVRRAQRTYRLKKEATLQQTKQRVIDLERKLDRVSSSFASMMEQLDPGVRETSPALVQNLHAIYGLLVDESGETSASASASASTSRERPQDSRNINNTHPLPHTQNHPTIPPSHPISISTTSSPTPYPHPHPLPQSLPTTATTTRYSTSHHSKSFTRHLHRLSLEHAFHLFHDARTHPLKIYQVFRLVPCIRDKGKMDPYFRRLVYADPEGPLELYTLPFYCVGGAGSHYPVRDGEERVVYPVNSRLPGRVLGGLVGGDGRKEEVQKEGRLQAYGLGGVWFDCRDVEGYLREMGVRLDQGLFPEVRPESVRDDSEAAEQLQASLLDSVQGMGRESDIKVSSRGCRRILDIDSFLSKLLQGLVILGRAPGFRRTDVVAAFHSALSTSQAV